VQFFDRATRFYPLEPSNHAFPVVRGMAHFSLMHFQLFVHRIVRF